MGCNVRLKVQEKEVDKYFYEELTAMKAMEKPSVDQNENEHNQHSNPK